MDHARPAGRTASVIVMIVSLALAPAGLAWGTSSALAADVAWPISSLVVSEVQTGGTSASDEFVEIANQGAGAVDLAGLEVVYATSSGSTVTRKATWTVPTMLESGRRVLLANAAGSIALGADMTYTGGFAAAGGAVALRPVGGTAIDSIGWGDAVSGFVEGAAAPAPPAGSSLERLPGGAAGNAVDTNMNLADWMIQVVPSPQGLSAAPIPPTVTPTPTPTLSPTPTSAPTPSPTPAATPTPSPTSTPTSTPTPTPVATPSPIPAPTPTPSPAPVVTSIDQGRLLPGGTEVTVAGTLTTALGALESGRSAFVQDSSAGIGLYLDAAVNTALPAGTTIRVTGTLDSRYQQRVLRIAEANITLGAVDGLPGPVSSATGLLGETLEGTRVSVTGTVIGSADDLADGRGIDVDDGSGIVRVVVGPDALAGRSIAAGDLVTVTGPLGQRDTGGTGLAGYRIHATLAGELAVATPTPTPTPTPGATPQPTASPTSAPTIVPGPTASAAPSPSPVPSGEATESTPAVARTRAIGSWVTVRATVTAEVDRLGTLRLFAIGDDTGGIAVRLPLGESGPRRGSMVVVTGQLAAPYGQLEMRPKAGGVRVVGTGRLPTPLVLASSGPDEASEGRLVSVTGRLLAKPSRSAAGDLTFRFERTGGTTFTVQADVSSGITVTDVQARATYRVTGIAGQRASRTGALDGYRVWARERADLVLVSSPAPLASPSGSARPSASAGSTKTISIAQALRVTDRRVVIEGTVTATSSLLDATGRRIVVQDATGAVEVYLPAGSSRVALGAHIRVTGTVGMAYGSPRLRATDVGRVSRGPAISPLRLFAAPTGPHLWRLVTVTGRIDEVRKLGDRWRAELVVGGTRIPITGQPGASIPVTRMVEGRTASVTGIVRAAYPSASDKRAAILPRSAADVRVDAASRGGSAATTPGGSGATGAGPGGRPGLAGRTNPANTTASGPPAAVDVDLDGLAEVEGRFVRVGGLVVDLGPDRFRIDDGTAIGTIVLAGDALELLALIEPGDVVNVDGTVTQSGGTWVVTTSDPAGLTRPGNPVAPGDELAASPGKTEASASPAVLSLAGFDLPGAGGTGLAGIGALLLMSLVSLAVTLGLRRRRSQRAFTGRVAARLAAIAAPTAAAEHDPRLRDSA